MANTVPGMLLRIPDAIGKTVILTNVGGTYDGTKCGPHSVVKVASGDYRMWYEGINLASTVSSVCYATSSDGTSWTKYASNPVYTPGVAWENNEACPTTVIRVSSSDYRMWYHGGFGAPRKIGYATSTDGISWTPYAGNPVLTVGGGGTWDAINVYDCKVIMVSSTDFRMWYRGENASAVKQIGYATSTDGISWTKYGSNPIFSPGSSGQWDDGALYCFAPYRISGNEYHGWYISDDGDGLNTQMGYAYSSDGISWTRGAYNPILKQLTNPPNAVNDIVTDSVDVYVDTELPYGQYTRDAAFRITYGDYDLTIGQRAIGQCSIPVTDGPTPSGVLIDDFTRANQGPPPGTSWANNIQTSGGGEGLVVLSNQLTRASAGQFRQGSWYTRRFPADIWAILDISSYTATGSPGFAFYVRLSNLNSALQPYGYALDWSGFGIDIGNILRYIGPGGSLPMTGDLSFSLATGDKVAVGARGQLISAWRLPSGGSWVRILHTLDTTASRVMGSGWVGVEMFDGQNLLMDNLTVGEIGAAIAWVKG